MRAVYLPLGERAVAFTHSGTKWMKSQVQGWHLPLSSGEYAVAYSPDGRGQAEAQSLPHMTVAAEAGDIAGPGYMNACTVRGLL